MSFINPKCLQYNAPQVPANGSVAWREPSLLYESGPARLGFGNLSGGWETGGLAGTLKLTMPTAFTVAMLAWGLLEFPDVCPYLRCLVGLLFYVSLIRADRAYSG